MKKLPVENNSGKLIVKLSSLNSIIMNMKDTSYLIIPLLAQVSVSGSVPVNKRFCIISCLCAWAETKAL